MTKGYLAQNVRSTKGRNPGTGSKRAPTHSRRDSARGSDQVTWGREKRADTVSFLLGKGLGVARRGGDEMRY